MTPIAAQMPPGFRSSFLPSVASTNAEALRRAALGEAGNLWIWAKEQTAGRGRAGRSWASPPGNLYASLLLRLNCPLRIALQLSLMAGVAAISAIAQMGGGRIAAPPLQLKWPNDILLAGAKLGGILVESSSSVQTEESVIVIGTGINLSSHPEAGRPATSLSAHGLAIEPHAALQALAAATASWLDIWRAGAGFSQVRTAWLEFAHEAGQPITVHLGNAVIEGTFLGIDEAGALLMRTADGAGRRVTAGDVFFERTAAKNHTESG